MSPQKIMVIGSSNTDMTVVTQRLPQPGETILGGHFKMGAGGKGANQAVAAKRLGGDVSFVCKVGNDLFGDKSIASYKGEGMDVSHIMRCETHSGVALITVDEKAENSIVVASGANAEISEHDIEALADEIRAAGILLLQLEIPIPAVVKAAQIAHEAGVTVVLNPAPACSLPQELYECTSILIPNETEIALLTGCDADDEAQCRKAAETLYGKGVRNLILTLGSKGCLIVQEGDWEGRQTVPALKVNAVDTTAAGDTFCGALCVALSEGKGLIDAAVFATKAAALSVQKYGAQESVPYRKDI